ACAWPSIHGRQASGMTTSGNRGGTARRSVCSRRGSSSGHGAEGASAAQSAIDMTYSHAARTGGAVHADATRACGEDLLWALASTICWGIEAVLPGPLPIMRPARARYPQIVDHRWGRLLMLIGPRASSSLMSAQDARGPS